MSLRAASGALAAGDLDAAIEHAVQAWRAVRDPRIADVIDLMSARIVAARGPLDGGTLGERAALWTKACERTAAADLGRMLAVPWPGKWQSAQPLVEILSSWPDDPRLGAALTKLFVAQPYRSQTSWQLYRDVAPVIVRIADVRGREALASAPSTYGVTHPSKQLESAYATEVPSLPADEAAALAEIQRYFALDVHTNVSRAASVAEHTAAILEAPDDWARRAVFADWLTERSDPRGELIALQLARRDGRATKDTRDRERALIEKHGASWAGSLAEHFAPKPLLFEDGFFAGGVLRRISEERLDVVLADPAFRCVRVLEIRWRESPALLDHPNLAGVRAVLGVDARFALALATGRVRTLEELSVRYDWLPEGADPSPLGSFPSLPRLRALGVHGSRAAFVLEAPVLARIERLSVSSLSEEQWTALAARDTALREVEIVNQGYDPFLDYSGWRFSLRRERAEGPFTHLEAQWVLGPRAHEWNKESDLHAMLASIPAGWLRSIVVHPSRALRWPASRVAKIREALARFPSLERVETPWDLSVEKPVAPAEVGPVLGGHISGSGFFEENAIAAIYDALVARGLVFDTFTVGYNGAPRPLGKDPRAKVLQWAKNSRIDRIELRRDGSPRSCSIGRSNLHLDGIPSGNADDLATWFEALLAHSTIEGGAVRGDGEPWTQNDILWPYARVSFGRVTLLGGTVVALFSDESLRGLAEAAGDPSLRVRRTDRHLLVASSEAPTEERHRTLARALRAIVDRRVRELRGYDPIEALAAGIAETAAAIGLSERRDEPTSSPINVSFAAPIDGIERLLHAGIRTPADDPRLTVSLRSKADSGYWTRELEGNVPVPDRASLDTALAAACVRARAEAAAFFAAPEPKRRRP